MSVSRTYLDYNATAPLRPGAREAMLRALDSFGNPSSVHAEGRRARSVIECARAEIAGLVGAQARDVAFTSGATESANWVLSAPWRKILVSAVEHPAVTAPATRAGAQTMTIPVDANGLIDVELFANLLRNDIGDDPEQGDVLVAVQFANNETGVVQPIAEIAGFVHEHGAQLLVDAVQAAGRIEIDMATLGVDYLMISSHKIGGPQGVGALVFGTAESNNLKPLIVGGGQERNKRAGTENVPALAGFGAAAVAAKDDLLRVGESALLRDELEARLKAATPGLTIFAKNAPRLCNTTLVALPGASAETTVIGLDLNGVAASAGSACSSGKTARSPVLAAMDVSADMAKCAVRFSLGWATNEKDIAACEGAWQRVMKTRGGERQVA
ncbi:MAG: cysteine desulfurase [Hyphomicrobiaceae bacterium]|nr:cysteine desulfurase [Hyphomicrobiaceae bacterium]MCC0011592.1 cysteine desulfurase [Hyphomicrobiaceae bacterium]